MALLAAYNFDEVSGDVVDRSGNGHDFPLNNNLVRTTGHTNGGVTKSGVGLPVIASPAFGQTTGRTFMFWQQALGDAVWWLRWYVTAADTGAWGLYNLGGTLNLRLRKGGTNTNTTAAAPADGLWHHYAGTYDGTNARLYIDGALVATSAAVTAPLDAADRIDMMEGTLPNFVVDDLRVYDEALDQATIAALMDTPVVAAADPSGEGTATLTIGVSGAGVASRPGEAAAAFALIDLAMSGDGHKTVTASAGATFTIAATAADSTGRDVTVTASLASQDRLTSTLGARRWAARLEAQP